MFGGQSGFNFEVPPESFIAEEDIVPDDDDGEDPDYCEPMIVSVQLSDRDQLKVCPRASATPGMPVGIEDRSMGDRSLEPMIVAIELPNRNILTQNQDSLKTVNSTNTTTASSEDARTRRETQLLAEPVSVIKDTALEAHSVSVSESKQLPSPPPPAAEVQVVDMGRKSAESAIMEAAASAPVSEIGGDAPVPADVSNEIPESAEVSSDAMETADVSNYLPRAAEISNEAPETAEVSNKIPETAAVCENVQKAAEISSNVPAITADVSSGDVSKNADVGINGDRDTERVEQRMDSVSLQEAEREQQEPVVTQTEEKVEQQGDTAGDSQEAQMDEVPEHEEKVEVPPTTTPPTTEDTISAEPQPTECTEETTPLINIRVSADENQKVEQEPTPPEQEPEMKEPPASGDGAEGALQLEETEGEKMEEGVSQGDESVAPTTAADADGDEPASTMEEAPEDKVNMEVEEKSEHEVEGEGTSERLPPKEDDNISSQAEGKITEETSSDKVEGVTPAELTEEESVPPPPQLPSDETQSEDATAGQIEGESEPPCNEIRQEEQTTTPTISEAENEAAKGPSDEVITPDEPTAMVTQAAQGESEPSDEVISEKQSSVVTGGEEVSAGSSVGEESREVEQEEREEETTAAVVEDEATEEQLPLSTEADAMAVGEIETEVEDKDVDQTDTVDQQERVDDEKEEEDREIAESAVAGNMGDEIEQKNEPKSIPTSEEFPPSLVSQREDVHEPSKYETHFEEEEDRGDDKMEIESTQDSESGPPSAPLSLEMKSSSPPPPPPSSEGLSTIPTIIVSMESSAATTAIPTNTSSGDGAVDDSDSVVEPASGEAGEPDTPPVVAEKEHEHKQEETISHQAEVDSHVDVRVPAVEEQQPLVDATFGKEEGETAREIERKVEVETDDAGRSEISEEDPGIETSCMELPESTFEIEQASVIVEPPSSVRDELESELMLTEDFDDDMDLVDSEHEEGEEEMTAATDEDIPVISAELPRMEGGEMGIDESAPVISSEPSCEEETTKESSREETAVTDELAPVVSPLPDQEEGGGEMGIHESAPVISSEPSCEEETPSKEERETPDEVVPVVSSETVQELAGDEDAPALSSEPVQEGENEANITSEDAADKSKGAAVNEHEEEGPAPVISSEPVDDEEQRVEEIAAESASQPEPPSTESSPEVSDEIAEQQPSPEVSDEVAGQHEETGSGDKEDGQSSMEVTAGLDNEEASGDAEKEQGQPLMETTPNPDELTGAVAEQEREGEQEQLMELYPDQDKETKPEPDLGTDQTTGDVSGNSGGEQNAAVGDEGGSGGSREERKEEEEEGEGEVSRESGGLQLESGPIEVDVLLHAEEDDLSVFSAEAAEADKALTSSSSSSRSGSSRKKPQTSSSASSSSSRQRRLSKSSSSALVGSPSLGEVAKASSSTGPGGASSSAVCSSTASGSSSARRVSLSTSSGTEAASSGGGEKRPRSEKSEVRNDIVCLC